MRTITELEEKLKIKKQAESLCRGDNNNIVCLSSAYSDWIECILDEKTIEIDYENMRLEVQGYIRSMNFWYDENRKQYVSEWGEGFEFSINDGRISEYDEETKKGIIKDVYARWIFDIKIEKYQDYSYIEFIEIDAAEEL